MILKSVDRNCFRDTLSSSGLEPKQTVDPTIPNKPEVLISRDSWIYEYEYMPFLWVMTVYVYCRTYQTRTIFLHPLKN